MLTVERLQDALDDAVRNGRIMPGDAQDLGQRIAHAGRRQLDELLAEVDKLRAVAERRGSRTARPGEAVILAP